MNEHLDEERLGALLDESLEGAERALAESHLESCPACRAALTALFEQDQALRRVLEHDPGDAYFEDFAARVGGRLRAAGLQGAQARRRVEGVRLAEWFQSPRKLALVGAVATVIAAAGIVMLSSREVRIPALRRREIENRAEQVSPPLEAPAPAAGVPAGPREGAAPPSATGEAAPAPSAGTVAPAAPAPAPAGASPERGAVPSPDLDSRERGARPLAAPSRVQEVRRDVTGEDVPVQKPGSFVYRPPEAPYTPAPPGTPVRVRKQRYAVPMGSKALDESAAAPAARSLAQEAAPGARPAARPATQVCGTLVDDSGRPVAGAQVVDRASGRSATSAADGSFCLPVEGDQVSVLAIGFQPASRTVLPGQSLRIALVPVRVLGTTGNLAPRQKLAVRGAPDAFEGAATWTRTHARNAQRLTALAEQVRTAPAWDSAALEWERTLEGAAGTPLESETRWQAARARHRAWSIEATPRRARALAAGLEAFLARAPRGAQRDSAQAWSRALGR